MQPNKPIRSDFVFRSDKDTDTLEKGWDAHNFDIHIILPNGGNRRAEKHEIIAICTGNLDAKLALYPQSARMDVIDIDRGGYGGVKAVIQQLSGYTDLEFLVCPSKTPGRYHVYAPVAGDSAIENTSPKWHLEGSGGEIKGGTSRITLYHPKSVINWITQMIAKEGRIDPKAVRDELCGETRITQSSEGSYRKFLKRDLGSHDNVLSAFLAVFEAGKRGEIDASKLDELSNEITEKALAGGRESAEIERAKENARNFVDNQTGAETEEIGSEKRAVRVADIDMANFFQGKFADYVKYVDELGKYICWLKGGKLARSKGANWDVADILHEIAMVISQRYGSDEKERLYYGSAQRAKAVDTLLKGQVMTRLKEFDSHSHILGVPGFDVDLKTSKMDESEPRNMVTKRTSVIPNLASSQTPIWDKFLLDTFGEDIAPYMARYLGYCLTGTVRESKVLFLVGEGGSGKTTFANVVRRIMGDYATSIAKKVLFPGRHSSDMHLTFIAQLNGKRVAIVPETDSYDKLNESLFKSLSGNDEITANFMRRDPFTFTNTAKLFVLSNSKPRLSSFDRGIRRRLVIVPCDNIPPEIDLDLENKIMGEASGILAKMIAECKTYCERGLLQMPDVVETVTEQHIDSQDLFGCYIRDNYKFDPNGKVSSQAILDGYKEHLIQANEQWIMAHFTMRDLQNEMKRYEPMGVVGPKNIRIGNSVPKGYTGLYPTKGDSESPL